METEIIKSGRLDKINVFMEQGYYDSVIKECVSVLEDVMKKVVGQALSSLPYEDRREITEKESEIGKGKRGYGEFTFGDLSNLFRASKLLDKWSRHTGADMKMIKAIDLNIIKDLRNKLTHGAGAMTGEVSRPEAKLVYDCMLNWLGFIGYREMDKSVESAFAPVSDGAKGSESQGFRVYDRVKKDITSGYDSSIKEERRRLRRQSAYSEAHDAASFAYALERLGHKEGLVGLDVGCADGYVTQLRFKEEYGFKRVIGIDNNASAIERACAEESPVFHYRRMDIESRSFPDDMEDLLEEEGLDGFDLIFCALTLHHLKAPVRFLMRVRRYLNKGGVLIIRGVDDGGMLAYDDEGLLEDILDDCTRQSNVSDRFHGRKFYPWLRSVGFTDIKMSYQVDDTSAMDPDEREDFFHYYFDFRLQYTLRPLKAAPEDPVLLADHERMVSNLERLEELFAKPEFFFSTLTVTAIAVK